MLQALPAYVTAECLDALTPPLVLNEYRVTIEQDELRHDLFKRLGNRRVSLLINDRNEDAILRWASYEGSVDIVNLLVNSNGVSVNEKSSSGMNPLLLASFAGNSEVVEVLVGVHKINLNVVDENGMTPLMWASYKGHHKIVDILLNRNVDLSITVVGLNASDLANRAGHSDIAEKIDQMMNGNHSSKVSYL